MIIIYTCLFLLTSTHDNTVVITIITPTSIIITVLTVTATSTDRDMFLVSEDPVYCNEHKKLHKNLTITVMLCFFIRNNLMFSKKDNSTTIYSTEHWIQRKCTVKNNWLF